jgi:pimeloyl-ACP methyl ester carboxylesterase
MAPGTDKRRADSLGRGIGVRLFVQKYARKEGVGRHGFDRFHGHDVADGHRGFAQAADSLVRHLDLAGDRGRALDRYRDRRAGAFTSVTGLDSSAWRFSRGWPGSPPTVLEVGREGLLPMMLTSADPWLRAAVFEKSGHLPFCEEPDAFVSKVETFLPSGRSAR